MTIEQRHNVESNWVVYALLSSLFAGLTAVLAKHGLAGISGELGLVVRTGFVCVFVIALAIWRIPLRDFTELTRHNWMWLAFSALTTSASWIFYYKALDDGEVSTVSVIDKGSLVVAVVLAWLFLGERVTLRTALAVVLVMAGLLLAIKK